MLSREDGAKEKQHEGGQPPAPFLEWSALPQKSEVMTFCIIRNAPLVTISGWKVRGIIRDVNQIWPLPLSTLSRNSARHPLSATWSVFCGIVCCFCAFTRKLSCGYMQIWANNANKNNSSHVHPTFPTCGTAGHSQLRVLVNGTHQ